MMARSSSRSCQLVRTCLRRLSRARQGGSPNRPRPCPGRPYPRRSSKALALAPLPASRQLRPLSFPFSRTSSRARRPMSFGASVSVCGEALPQPSPCPRRPRRVAGRLPPCIISDSLRPSLPPRQATSRSVRRPLPLRHRRRALVRPRRPRRAADSSASPPRRRQLRLREVSSASRQPRSRSLALVRPCLLGCAPWFSPLR